MLALFPEWFAPAPDYPSQLRFGGFPLYDERIEHDLPADVQRFLDAGEPPIVATFGSGMRIGGPVFCRSRRRVPHSRAPRHPADAACGTDSHGAARRASCTLTMCRSACCCRTRPRSCITEESAPAPGHVRRRATDRDAARARSTGQRPAAPPARRQSDADAEEIHRAKSGAGRQKICGRIRRRSRLVRKWRHD